MQNILESLKKQREQILRDSSEEMLNRHTNLLEIAVISLYNRLANTLKVDGSQFRAGAAVLALGAFGRGVIGPLQRVDILVLTTDSSTWEFDWIKEIVDPLREAGWQVETERGSIREQLERAEKDYGFLAKLVEGRYISGSRQLADRLNEELESFLENRRDIYLNQLYDDACRREQQLLQPESWLEPDLLEHPGGLAEIDSIRVACRIAANIRCLDDAIFLGYLDRQEVDFLRQAEKKYIRLLSLLRSDQGGAAGVLQFDRQETIAAGLGYSARVGFLPVEVFMREIHQLLHGVQCISQEFWERIHESRWASKADADTVSTPLEMGLVTRHGKIQLQADLYPATAGHLVHLFQLAAGHRLSFSNITRQWIQHHRNVLDTAAGDAMVKEELLDLIRAEDDDLYLLRRFYNQRLLTSLVPELAAVHGLVQHDAFHLYPVQEHHFRTLAELKKLFAGDYRREQPVLTKIAEGLEDPILLFLAALLHDIGKSAGRDHALHGGEMIPSIAGRLGLTPEESDVLQFLVVQHLLLMDSASLRDLADAEMLAQCALIIKTPMQLDLLLLLSFADMMATGPKARQKWYDTPVIELYERVKHLLDKGEPSPRAIAERIEQVRMQVERQVADLINRDELQVYFEQLAPRYLLSMTPGSIARHLRMERQLDHSEEAFLWEATVLDGATEVTLISRETPGLLAKVAGILTLRDLSITSAQIFSKENGVVLLIFQCRPPEGADCKVDWDSAREDMQRVLQGKWSLPYRIAAHAAQKGYDRPLPRQSPSRVLIDNDSSQLYTILEVYTTDRVGLLYAITWTLWELQVRIFVAKITTRVDQVADVFYIKTMQGEKITDPERIDEIGNALLFRLDGPAAHS